MCNVQVLYRYNLQNASELPYFKDLAKLIWGRLPLR